MPEGAKPRTRFGPIWKLIQHAQMLWPPQPFMIAALQMQHADDVGNSS